MKKTLPLLSHRNTLLFLGVTIALLIIAGCTPGSERFTVENPAGFWTGIWHGAIAVISFIISLFNKSVNIYELNNTGAWYNFGFLFGLIAVWGGSCSSACKKKKSQEEVRNEEEWKEVEKKVENKIKRKIREWVDSDEEEDWSEVEKKLEDKIKRKLKEWAEEE